MKKLISRLAGDINTVKLNKFNNSVIHISDLKDSINCLLPELYEGNEESNKLVEAYYKINNDREFDLLFREYVLSSSGNFEFKTKVNLIATRIAYEKAVNDKIKSYFEEPGISPDVISAFH